MSSHAERALALFQQRDPKGEWTLEAVQAFILGIELIEQTREPEPRKVPQPLTFEDAAYYVYSDEYHVMTGAGLGIYRVADVEGCCK